MGTDLGTEMCYLCSNIPKYANFFCFIFAKLLQTKKEVCFCNLLFFQCFYIGERNTGNRTPPSPGLGEAPCTTRCANSANGADTRTRTGDLRITNALLYQLSHIGGIALQSYIKKNKQPNFLDLCFCYLVL